MLCSTPISRERSGFIAILSPRSFDDSALVKLKLYEDNNGKAALDLHKEGLAFQLAHL